MLANLILVWSIVGSLVIGGFVGILESHLWNQRQLHIFTIHTNDPEKTSGRWKKQGLRVLNRISPLSPGRQFHFHNRLRKRFLEERLAIWQAPWKKVSCSMKFGKWIMSRVKSSLVVYVFQHLKFKDFSRFWIWKPDFPAIYADFPHVLSILNSGNFQLAPRLGSLKGCNSSCFILRETIEV